MFTKVLVAFQTSLFLSSFASRLRWPKNKFEKLLRTQGIQLAVFLSPNPLALIVHSVPIVTTVWDLGHRDLPELPEFSRDNTFKEREFFYENTLPRSWMVLVDSEVTKKRIENLYGVKASRVHKIGLLPFRPIMDSAENYSPPYSNYIFYPAQFWSHKNHLRLIDAFKLVQKHLPDLNLVFSGSDKGHLTETLDYVEKIGLTNRVFYTGFVSRAEYWSLLQNSNCLVFPSLLGPTNLPPLEAGLVGKKMAISDFHFENMPFKNENLFYFDAYSPESISQAIMKTLNSADFEPISFDQINRDSVQVFIQKLSGFGLHKFA
jgi:glycosyltransferase involved in cell wall biosynthesis